MALQSKPHAGDIGGAIVAFMIAAGLGFAVAVGLGAYSLWAKSQNKKRLRTEVLALAERARAVPPTDWKRLQQAHKT